MSRGITTVRAGLVWLLASAVAAGAVRAAEGLVRDAAPPGTGAAGVSAVLVALCAVVLALALVRIWLVTTVTVAEVVAGSARAVRGHPGTTRRLVLLACGVAVSAGVATPAAAAGDDGREVVAGLALPERPVAGAPASTQPPGQPSTPAAAPAEDYVVQPGDSLWSIALAHPADAAPADTDTDARWRALWRANRAVVGDDPDLIHPGQALRLPAASPDSTERTQQDGDRR
ncbi:LysM peptidoglycan-binding domain-containing protein [Nocardioides sp. J2M5]|uniref:LysM peptidoglycan-binding domain-containing protein n=1 Tax=Nocardioides palaemonis TaxID=2829810 RepID=UPI001BAAD013|nr:LysM domain-containing protein [Nocardioides palaemonis]MBS2939026.1 LysM peptidoglycan-binding domain-containing protein [Nocardioides palaemonis]